MKRMLFNATQQEELRVAIVDGQKLIDIDIESNARELHKSNIYKAVITRIEPSLEACFVNYGEDRHGFLPFKEVARALFKNGVDVKNATIKDALSEGQEVMVQVEKEERGNKGAALTTFISLAGRYLVLMPNNPRGGGVSRRVEGEERQELRETMDKLDVPPGMSIIARTAGIGRTVEELQWDLNYLLQLWNAIENAGHSAPGAFLIYHESSLVIRAIRDYFQPDIGEILIDTDEIYEQARQFMSHVMPDMVNRVKRYRDDVPLFSRFQIEHQIETAYSRVVSLPSGGSIVIDHTEALVAVDVNSARSTRGTDIETTAFTTNCEAAEEVARQLRLRDLGGLIVIDFIDMESPKNRREIEARLKEALHYDRARVQMEKITRFGLMELSRQRLRPSLSEGSHIACPRCNGTGHIRDTESSALQVLRIIEEESMKESSAVIHVQIPVDVAAFLLNEKRGEIMKVENRHKVEIVLIPNKYLETPHYKLERIKHDDPRLEEPQVSYKLAERSEVDMSFSKRQKEPVKPAQEAMVKNIPEGLPAPVVGHSVPTPEEDKGFFDKLLGFLGLGSKEAVPEEPAGKPVKTGRKGKTGERTRSRSRRVSAEDKTKNVANDVSATPDETAGAAPKNNRQRRARPDRAERQRDERKPVRNGENGVMEETAVSAVTARSEVTALVPVTEAVRVVAVETEVTGETVASERPATEEDARRRRRRSGRGRTRRDATPESTDETVDKPAEETVASARPDSSVDGATRDAVTDKTEENAGGASEEKDAPARREARRSHPRRRRGPAAETAAASNPETIATETGSPVAETTASMTETVPQPVNEVNANEEATVTPEKGVPEESPGQADTENAVADHPEKKPVVETVKLDESTTVHFYSDQVIEVETVPAETAGTGSQTDSIAELERILAEAGLTMASTDPEKMKKGEESPDQAETQAAPRPARRRRSPAVNDEGPLIQVVTRQE